ncbi:MAG: hypothetical protein EA408_04655 [Marinilabiliales bacterium]|nr:MAG: hypothetical protein EA408_04655 [Marinilabiliales bacterium]
MRKIWIITYWIVIAAYMAVVSGFVSGRLEDKICEMINITIIDSLNNRFVSQADVMDMLLSSDADLLGYPINRINTRKLEEMLRTEPFIKKAKIYKTVNGALNADIAQRRPVLRVINRHGESYYIDEEGFILPLSEKFTSRTLVANGNISEPFIAGSTRTVFDSGENDSKRDRVINDLYELAMFIAGSGLWSAQISQIYVNNNYEYELIPRVGAHVIILGDASGYEKKFRKLEALYFYGLNNEGWNKYEIINLKYENQVVCTKR